MTHRVGNPIVLATGGTGGHVFPAQALAAELQQRGHEVAVVTDDRGGAFEGTATTYRIRASRVGKSPAAVAATMRDLAIGVVSAFRILRRLRPGAVVGFGGYASVPTLLAARILGIPRLLHEQNAILGRANRFLARHADRIAISFAEVEAVQPVLRGKLVRTGNPVRATIAALSRTAYEPPVGGGPVSLLILGGSQGARVFSDVVPEALAALPTPLRDRLHVTQQCRAEDLERVRGRYAQIGIAAELSNFFADIPQRLATAHLVITRAGASSVAELMAAGRPAILVPYPSAMDDHQTANARAVDSAGAAWLMPQGAFSPEAVAARIEAFLNLPKTLEEAAARAVSMFQPDAAARLADLVEQTMREDKAPARNSRAHGAIA